MVQERSTQPQAIRSWGDFVHRAHGLPSGLPSPFRFERPVSAPLISMGFSYIMRRYCRAYVNG